MATMPDQEKDALRQEWLMQFNTATQADAWGQVVEASDEYQRLAANIAFRQGMPFFASMDKDTMQKLSLCLAARLQALGTLGLSANPVSAFDMKALQPVFEALFTGREVAPFPVETNKYQTAQLVQPNRSGEIMCEGEDCQWQQHQAALKTVTGTVVCLRIDKIGLKDAQDYIDPYMTILVAAPTKDLLDTHDTPIAGERLPTYVMFNHQVYLNISLEDMQSNQAALFFEFKHYKPKKKKISTRCWAFMELTELKCDEEIVLELYHKPTDLRKKNIKLHTAKPLYLHLYASFVRS